MWNCDIDCSIGVKSIGQEHIDCPKKVTIWFSLSSFGSRTV